MCTRDVEFLGMSFVNIAGAVTGSQPCKLTGWERADAIRAMRALHWRGDRIQAALLIERRWYLLQVARKAGIDMSEPDVVDEMAISFILDGCPMQVDGATRVEAIRRLAPTHGAPDISRLTMTPDYTVRHLAVQNGIELIPAPTADCWWSQYVKHHGLAVAPGRR